MQWVTWSSAPSSYYGDLVLKRSIFSTQWYGGNPIQVNFVHTPTDNDGNNIDHKDDWARYEYHRIVGKIQVLKKNKFMKKSKSLSIIVKYITYMTL